MKLFKTILLKDGDEYYRVKVIFGRVYLNWFRFWDFPLKVKPNGVLICKYKGIRMYNKPFWMTWILNDGRRCENDRI